MANLVSLLAMVVGGVLVLSALAKLVHWETQVDWLDQAFTPRLPPSFMLIGVVAAELILAALVLVHHRIGGVAVAAWVTLASVVLLAVRRRMADCACFGARTPLGRRVVVRNAALIAAAATVAGAAAVDVPDVEPIAQITAAVGGATMLLAVREVMA